MAESKMKEVAQLLGVELAQEFYIIGVGCNPYMIIEDGLIDGNSNLSNIYLAKLLNGSLKIKKTILTEKEKRYLENVLRPFKDDVNFIAKYISDTGRYFINVSIGRECEDCLSFPFLKNENMYKNIELSVKYSLKDLGLFEED